MHIENVIMIINVRNKCKLVEDGLSKKLEDMSLEELWQLFPIILVKYNNTFSVTILFRVVFPLMVLG